MKKNIENTLKPKNKMWSDTKLFLSSFAILGTMITGALYYNAKDDIPLEVFKNAKIIEYFNENGTLEDEFEGENVLQTPNNKYDYIDRTRKLNNGNEKGWIKAYDLDGNGLIGNDKNKDHYRSDSN